ncbi:MAG: hypothetical protein IKU86_07185, partial [Thermoguttaceae bacterium]|nr:hypothetical protein [Thermoguttaceae bacterium]
MQDVLSFEMLTLKELGALASEARVPRWSRLKKAELVERLVAAGVPVPTVEELAERRRREQEERRAQNSPLSPPNGPSSPLFDAASNEPLVPQNNEQSEKKIATETEKIKNTVDAEPAASPTPPSVAPEAVSEATARALSFKEKMRTRKIIGSPTDRNDRLVLTVCDSYWLRARWEATPRSVERVRSAMGPSWHTAEPTIRVYRVDREP